MLLFYLLKTAEAKAAACHYNSENTLFGFVFTLCLAFGVDVDLRFLS
jgi:hypothetical protein